MLPLANARRTVWVGSWLLCIFLKCYQFALFSAFNCRFLFMSWLVSGESL